MTAVAEQTGAWLAAFTDQRAAAPWVQELRNRAFQKFAEAGFPTTHDEEWRFTNVAAIARGQFALRAPGLKLRLPAGLVRASLEDAHEYLAALAPIERNAFVALNTAFVDDAVIVRVPRGLVVEESIEIAWEAAGRANGAAPYYAPRVLLMVGADAHCTVVERFAGRGEYFTNAVTEIAMGDRAVVDHYRLQQESLEAFHVSTLEAQLGRSTNFSTHNISLGGALARHDVNTVLAEGSEATVNGLYLVGGTQHVDNHTSIDHAKPHGTSRELYKGILDGQAQAVFNGRVIVRQDAQKTDSKQTNKNLVLSDDAVVNTKPELQIFADDVRCTHGATIGQLDAESMFYLQSRGIGRSEARSLLTYAFAQDVVDRIKVGGLRDSLERILFEKFHEHGKQ